MRSLLNRGPLSERRAAHVAKVFKSIDSDSKGSLSITDLWNNFKGDNFDDVKFKKRTKQQLFDELTDHIAPNGDGQVCLTTWTSFYEDFRYPSLIAAPR